MSNSCKVPFNVPRGTFSFFGIAFGLLQAKGFFLFLRLGPSNQPGLSGREGAFCPIPAKYPSMFHVELFLSSVLPLARSRPKVFSFASGSAQETSPALLTGRAPFASFPPAIMQMFHVELFLSSVLPLARSGPKAFFFSSGSAKKPARPVRRGGDLLPDYTPKPIQMFHMEHFSPFKMPKSRVLCALLVSIPLQVCYNNRRSPFSG